MKIKSLILILVAVMGVTICTHCKGKTLSYQENDDAKTLIVYFSWGGNTRIAAAQIHKIVGGDMVEVEVLIPYSDVYGEVVERYRKERDENILPELKTSIVNIDQYQTIIVGTPIWGGHLVPAMKSFLSNYDLSGKDILPFCTHGGSGVAQSVDDIRSVCPDSRILQPLAIYGKRATESKNDIIKWLTESKVLSAQQ